MERTPQCRPALRPGLAAVIAVGLGGGIGAATTIGQPNKNVVKNQSHSGPPAPGAQTLEACKTQQAPLKSMTCAKLGKILLSFDRMPIALPEPDGQVSNPRLALGEAAMKQKLNVAQTAPEAVTRMSPPIDPNIKTVPTGTVPKETSTTTTNQVAQQSQTASSASLQGWLYALRMCESGGNYQENSGNGYYGAYQFSFGTWSHWNTGYAYASEAPPSVQDATIIENTNASVGGLATQNPGCYAKEKLSQFPPSS